jgi:uncharacterized membrane protein
MTRALVIVCFVMLCVPPTVLLVRRLWLRAILVTVILSVTWTIVDTANIARRRKEAVSTYVTGDGCSESHRVMRQVIEERVAGNRDIASAIILVFAFMAILPRRRAKAVQGERAPPTLPAG